MIGVGLRVEGRFDGGDDIWLGMENSGGKEWAVGYHGIRWPKPE